MLQKFARTHWLTRREIIKSSLYSVASWLSPKTLKSFAPDAATVIWMWSGAVTPTTAKINAKISTDHTVTVVVSENSDLSSAVFQQLKMADEDNKYTVSFDVTNLQPDTSYFYGIKINGLQQLDRGQFATPAVGPFSFNVAFGSCAMTGSTHPVFNTIRQLEPFMFIHMGDMHYSDITVANVNPYHDAFSQVLTAANQRELYRNIPTAYMWDDHDYAGDNSDATAVGRSNARQAYQHAVPHYPLTRGTGDVPLYHAFTIGRVRFILTDTRSKRDPSSNVDSASKSMLGWTQKQWLKYELLSSRDTHAAIVWVSTSPWIANSGVDTWHQYQYERREISDFVRNNQITNLCCICGDAHMLAIDNGTNNNYSTGNFAGFPVMQAAALDQGGYYLPATTFSKGHFPGRGQFGLMRIIDNGIGSPIQIQWRGKNQLAHTIVSHDFTLNRIPSIGLSRDSIGLTAYAGGTQNVLQNVTIFNRIDTGSFNWQIVPSSVPSWLNVSALSGADNTTVTLTANLSGLALGSYSATLKIQATGVTNSPKNLPVNLIYTNRPPVYLPILKA